MDIEIPSPSVFLRRSPAPVSSIHHAPPAQKKTVKSKGAPKPKINGKDASGAISKPKQSKSRNGCMTCKKKRLKCDETKPSCAQCQKRNVTCEGYKKDFKWRSFEETTFNNKVASKRKTANTSEHAVRRSSIPADDNWPLENAFASASHAFQGIANPTILSPPNSVETLTLPNLHSTWNPSKFDLPSPGPSFDLDTTPVPQDGASHSPSFSGGSPSLSDLLLPGTDMNQPPDVSEERPPLSPKPYQPGPYLDQIQSLEEADEEIIRDSLDWRLSSPTPSDQSSTSSRSSSGINLLGGPKLDQSSSEMLLLRFDRNTCGILSVKDGPTENPWRTLIWPLAQNSPCLFHAISSMTAFHGAVEHPQLRVTGVAHMQKSIKRLAADLGEMRVDSALATSLALALGEGWDEHASTGIQHLHGARIMVDSALIKHKNESQLGLTTPDDILRLRFLCNTFIYTDVIARLTSLQEGSNADLERIIETVNPPTRFLEVDPLMGCAITLFPLIGRVANLIQKVRKSKTNSLNIVSQANELQQQLLQWHTPNSFDYVRPEDPSSEVEHSVRTAESYRIATLLYLHQAVPEIPSDNHEAMAKRVLLLLASVPLSSRTVIIQIFPLFAAGCEVTEQEDRTWVTERFQAMMARLTIGNMSSCWKVLRTLWERRDKYQAEKTQRLMQLPNLPRRSTMTDIPLDQIDKEYTVRGRLHWIGVMSSWGWEVFLG